ncbi:MAG: hypothetical protein KDD52_08175 [Bdellovibrionales bacterium]|nr:hypothetical protein [Bdellovibrionales bacterium]
MKRSWLLALLLFLVCGEGRAQEIVPVVPIEAVQESEKTSMDSQPVGSEGEVLRQSSAMPIGRTNYPSFNLRAGAGTSFDPQLWWVVGSIEAQLDKFFALGPMVQVGFDRNRTFVLGTIGPRLIMPISFFEIGLSAGMGFSYRNEVGFTYTNFAYQAGINLDMYIIENFSVGLLANFNFLSSVALADVGSITGTLSYHF